MSYKLLPVSAETAGLFANGSEFKYYGLIYEIAEELNIHESVLSRKMRHQLSRKEQAEILNIIDTLALKD